MITYFPFFFAAFYAVLFKDLISAFATNSLWGALGWVICFAYSAELCTDVKIYICMGLLAVSAVGYYMVEYWAWQDKKLEKKQEENDKKSEATLNNLPPAYDVAVIDSNMSYENDVSSTAF